MAVIVIHLASYVPKLPRILSSQPADRARHMLKASRTRWLLLGGCLAAGLVLALLTYHLSAAWGDQAWTPSDLGPRGQVPWLPIR